MANTRINGYGGIFGNLLKQNVSILRVMIPAVARCKAIADEITGGGVTTSALEGTTIEFGTVPAGAGATLYNDLVSINTALAAIATSALNDLDQG